MELRSALCCAPRRLARSVTLLKGLQSASPRGQDTARRLHRLALAGLPLHGPFRRLRARLQESLRLFVARATTRAAATRWRGWAASAHARAFKAAEKWYRNTLAAFRDGSDRFAWRTRIAVTARPAPVGALRRQRRPITGAYKLYAGIVMSRLGYVQWGLGRGVRAEPADWPRRKAYRAG